MHTSHFVYMQRSPGCSCRPRVHADAHHKHSLTSKMCVYLDCTCAQSRHPIINLETTAYTYYTVLHVTCKGTILVYYIYIYIYTCIALKDCLQGVHARLSSVAYICLLQLCRKGGDSGNTVILFSTKLLNPSIPSSLTPYLTRSLTSTLGGKSPLPPSPSLLR